MNNLTKYLSILIFLLTACQKQEITNTVSRQGKIFGYQSDSVRVAVPLAFGEINHNTAAFTNSLTWLQLNVESNQAMITPQGLYAVPSAVTEVNGLDSTKIYTNNVKTREARVYKAPTLKQVVGLMYLPATAKTYAIQGDSVFEFTLNNATNMMDIGTIYPGLNLGEADNIKSSTAHGFLPQLYVVAKNKLAIMDVSTNTVDT